MTPALWLFLLRRRWWIDFPEICEKSKLTNPCTSEPGAASKGISSAKDLRIMILPPGQRDCWTTVIFISVEEEEEGMQWVCFPNEYSNTHGWCWSQTINTYTSTFTCDQRMQVSDVAFLSHLHTYMPIWYHVHKPGHWLFQLICVMRIIKVYPILMMHHQTGIMPKPINYYSSILWTSDVERRRHKCRIRQGSHLYSIIHCLFFNFLKKSSRYVAR